MLLYFYLSSNNTNKLSPQELRIVLAIPACCSNNTNKLSPQELSWLLIAVDCGSNNTNKLSPQEHCCNINRITAVQIIQINLVLKNL